MQKFRLSNKDACFTSILLFDFRDVSVKDVLTVPMRCFNIASGTKDWTLHFLNHSCEASTYSLP